MAEVEEDFAPVVTRTRKLRITTRDRAGGHRAWTVNVLDPNPERVAAAVRACIRAHAQANIKARRPFKGIELAGLSEGQRDETWREKAYTGRSGAWGMAATCFNAWGLAKDIQDHEAEEA